MKLTYMIHNRTNNDFPLEPGKTWQFIVEAEDTLDAYNQMEKVKVSAGIYNHSILNVLLDRRPFDARAYWTKGANSDGFEYDEKIKIDKLRDETT